MVAQSVKDLRLSNKTWRAKKYTSNTSDDQTNYNQNPRNLESGYSNIYKYHHRKYHEFVAVCIVTSVEHK